MNNFEDIQSLWQQAPAAKAPDIKQAIVTVKNRRRLMQLKSFGLVALLLFTLVFLVLIITRYDFKFISTRVGIALALLAIGAGVVVNSNMLGLLLKHNSADTSNHQYLQSLRKYRQRARFMHTYGISVYFLLMGIGILLYIYEFVHANTFRMILAYGLTTGWFLFAWFVLRPRTVKKQTAEIDDMISKLDEIDAHLRSE
ncbi:MAG: hypothetical protein J7578_14470 [Chitinophagaceae bacterium]|nr:hypothetical protein [Chitinophagaceae bacterium]